MISLKGPMNGPLFGIDSEKIYKEWYRKDTGEKKEFRCLVGVAVNPVDNCKFEDDYDRILGGLCDTFHIERERQVLSASDLARCFDSNVGGFENFCIGFARELMSLEDLKITFFITRINSSHLTDGKIHVYGDESSATQAVSIPEFIDRIYPYYNAVCAWKLQAMTKPSKSTFLLDGMQDIHPSKAWNTLCNYHHPRIVFRGDKIFPVISAADIICRYVTKFLRERRGIVDEHAIRDIVMYDHKVPEENKYYVYVGNPELRYIKPTSSRTLSPGEFANYIHHPIIFIGGGGATGQQSIIEESPLMPKILERASSIFGSVKHYDVRKDRIFIGKGAECDYFLPMNESAELQLQTLIKSGYNIERIEL